MPNNTNPAWRGGARQKVSFWSNGSVDNKELIPDTQACCLAAWSHPGRVTIALSGNAQAPPGYRRDNPYQIPEFIDDAMLERATMTPNVMQQGDALTLLRSLLDRCTPLVFFDPQHRAVLDKLKFGNEGARQRGRAGLPAMSESYIDDCCRESVRVLAPRGYLMRWVDTYTLCQARHLRIADLCQSVDLIAWDSLRIGNGYRSRRRGDYLLILQKPPITAKNWRDHGIPSRWPEKVDRHIHPHIKPIGLITRLIGAVTQPGDLVVDPAAGSFVVMRAAQHLGRNFIGCDLKLPALTSERAAVMSNHLKKRVDKCPPGCR
jgi:site-specific DNA-methyltransferase (adenine-specific)